MERLWSPWRYEYISGVSEPKSPDACVFCEIQRDPDHDEGNYVLYRGALNFIVLNIFPYISGHLLVVPNEHLSELDSASKETTDELMDLTKRCQGALRDVYQPSGFNIGMNQGRAAGAGIANHFHLHIMPRWAGDTNFLSTIAETRVIPEDLASTYQRLRGKF